MPPLDKIFSCRLKGIELNIFRGDIVMAETDAIAILCDPDFKLNAGVGRAIRNTGGQDFMNSLNEEKRKQRGSRVISVPISSGIRSASVLLAPVSGMDRHSLGQVYSAIIQKALDLRIESLSMPLLGTLFSSIDTASNYLWACLQQFSSFGRLKKIQIVDTNDFHMRSLHKFIIAKLRAQSQLHNGSSASSNSENNQSDDSRLTVSTPTGNTDSEQSFRLVGSGTSQSPIELFCSTGAGRNLRIALGRNNGITSTRFHRGQSHSDSRISINISIASEQETEQSSDDSVNSDDGSGDSDGNNENSDLEVTNGEAEMASNSSDASDSDDDDLFTHETDDGSDAMDSDDEDQSDEDANRRADALTREQEKQFWSIVPVEQLKTDDGNSQSSDKPSTSYAASQARLPPSQKKSQASSSSMRHPNVCLDDSSMPCSICLSDMREECDDDVVVQLSLCSHLFHKECIKSAFAVKRQCPLCMLWYGECVGYQPANATMTVKQVPGYVAGHRDAKGFHEITYHIPAGIQIDGHIRPGQPYSSTTRIAYLPNNREGTLVLKMLQLAFTRRLIFTIGDSVTTGRKNVPVWNNIHHKTNKKGGPQNYGYPDPSYLGRVREELMMVGVRSEQVN
ncbi:hypothetical protein niasHS_003408 [Heterodera schachtii]|uniref:E3 ubiquitin-protein ligase n=1 Tax=Heterodera schachtii TaxID=97005 RepID=A0ABD2KGF7_HETSC